ncbi:hypothetical protein ABTO99_18270, partial [Acinetobacter baumannii]
MPVAGTVFGSWGGDCGGSAISVTLTMSAARNCTATFATAGGTGGTPTIGGGGAPV